VTTITQAPQAANIVAALPHIGWRRGGFEPAVLGRLDCLTRHAVKIDPDLPAVSQKREFSNTPPETVCDFGLRMPKNQSLETGDQFAKVRRCQTFLRLSGPASPIAGLPAAPSNSFCRYRSEIPSACETRAPARVRDHPAGAKGGRSSGSSLCAIVNSPATLMLTGYLGASSEDNHTRLYFDPSGIRVGGRNLSLRGDEAAY
jgi:hypothetical protein